MITLTGTQEKAVLNILIWFGETEKQEFYLAGYAGTGKTTITEEAINRLKERYKIKNILTGAYTGKAAHVMHKKGAENAQTIHSMIYQPVEDPLTGETKFVLDEFGSASSADLIVLDECSMIDESMADDLRSFGKKILVLGDPGQLPPVGGQGAFTNRKPDAFLDEIHRQAADSPIIRLATMARQGQLPEFGEYGENVRVIPYNADAGHHVYDKESQVICGLNKVRFSLTQKIRTRNGNYSENPEIGETILCCKNDKDKGIFNGQLGTLLNVERSYIQPDFFEFKADMEDTGSISTPIHPYLFHKHFKSGIKRPKLPKGTGEFDWGYVLTCHKSQGSQWKRITVIDDSGSFRDDRWKWLYTAITRAESELTLVRRG